MARSRTRVKTTETGLPDTLAAGSRKATGGLPAERPIPRGEREANRGYIVDFFDYRNYGGDGAYWRRSHPIHIKGRALNRLLSLPRKQLEGNLKAVEKLMLAFKDNHFVSGLIQEAINGSRAVGLLESMDRVAEIVLATTGTVTLRIGDRSQDARKAMAWSLHAAVEAGLMRERANVECLCDIVGVMESAKDRVQAMRLLGEAAGKLRKDDAITRVGEMVVSESNEGDSETALAMLEGFKYKGFEGMDVKRSELEEVQFKDRKRDLERGVQVLDEFFTGLWRETERFGPGSALGYWTEVEAAPASGYFHLFDIKSLRPFGGYTDRSEREFWGPTDDVVKGLNSIQGFGSFFRQLKAILQEGGTPGNGYCDKTRMGSTVSNVRALALLDQTTEALRKRGVANADLFRDRVGELIYDHFVSRPSTTWIGEGYCYGPKIKEEQRLVQNKLPKGEYKHLCVTTDMMMYLTLSNVDPDVELSIEERMFLKQYGELIRRYTSELPAYRILEFTRTSVTPREFGGTSEEIFERAHSMLQKDRPLTAESILGDIGCGPGDFIKYLYERGFKGTVIALDSSPDMIAAAKKAVNRKKGVTVEEADAMNKIPVKAGTLTHAVCINVMQDYNRVEMRRLLKNLAKAMEEGATGVLTLEFTMGGNRRKIEGDLEYVIAKPRAESHEGQIDENVEVIDTELTQLSKETKGDTTVYLIKRTR